MRKKLPMGCAAAMTARAMMSEYLQRQRLLDAGYTWDEAEDELADRASDAYDQEKDYQLEEKANEDK
jgi:hypothetical protein